jgi:hypothetical protein
LCSDILGEEWELFKKISALYGIRFVSAAFKKNLRYEYRWKPSKITSQYSLFQYMSLLQVQYHYRYAVDDPTSGVVNDRWEHRQGEYVKGAYSVLEPDGQLRIVDYEVDGSKGFHAVVRTQFPGRSCVTKK